MCRPTDYKTYSYGMIDKKLKNISKLSTNDHNDDDKERKVYSSESSSNNVMNSPFIKSRENNKAHGCSGVSLVNLVHEKGTKMCVMGRKDWIDTSKGFTEENRDCFSNVNNLNEDCIAFKLSAPDSSHNMASDEIHVKADTVSSNKINGKYLRVLEHVQDVSFVDKSDHSQDEKEDLPKEIVLRNGSNNFQKVAADIFQENVDTNVEKEKNANKVILDENEKVDNCNMKGVIKGVPKYVSRIGKQQDSFTKKYDQKYGAMVPTSNVTASFADPTDENNMICAYWDVNVVCNDECAKDGVALNKDVERCNINRVDEDILCPCSKENAFKMENAFNENSIYFSGQNTEAITQRSVHEVSLDNKASCIMFDKDMKELPRDDASQDMNQKRYRHAKHQKEYEYHYSDEENEKCPSRKRIKMERHFVKHDYHDYAGCDLQGQLSIKNMRHKPNRGGVSISFPTIFILYIRLRSSNFTSFSIHFQGIYSFPYEATSYVR